MAHCERGMMLKSSSSSSSSRVVWEDFQGALRTHAAPHGNLKTGETPIAHNTTLVVVVESIAGKNQKGFWTTRSITCASLTFNNLAFVLVLAIEVMCRGLGTIIFRLGLWAHHSNVPTSGHFMLLINCPEKNT